MDLNFDLSARLMPPPPPPRGIQPTPRPTIPPRVSAFSTMDEVLEGVPAVIATYQPEGVRPQQMCLWLRLSQALTVDEVFAIHIAFKSAGVTCLYVETSLALTAEGERFPEAPSR